MKYYNIRVNDGVNSYSVFTAIAAKLENPNRDDIIGIAVDFGKLDQDDIRHVDNVTEIDLEEFKKATAELELTEEEVAAYLDNGYDGCPRCKDTVNLDCGKLEVDSNGAFQKITCMNCGFTYHDLYTLTGVEKL